MFARLFIVLAVLGTALPPLARGQSLRIAAAISLKESLVQIAADYERQGGGHVELQLGSSGQLLAQLREGAPIDVFIPASNREMAQLVQAGLVQQGSVVPVARNRMALIVPADAKDTPAGFADLADPRFRRVAIGEPRSVPAGQYAIEVLNSLKVKEALKDRLVYCANVRQVLDLVVRGEADAGIVYHTDAVAAGDAVRMIAIADQALHDPVVYPAAVISETKHKNEAEHFLRYLQSPAARQVLKGHGFDLPAENQP